MHGDVTRIQCSHANSVERAQRGAGSMGRAAWRARRVPMNPQKALCGGIPDPCLEPLTRYWSHFVGVYRQMLTTSLQN